MTVLSMASGRDRGGLEVVSTLVHTRAHSQCTVRFTGSRRGFSKLSCSTVQVTFLPSSWLVSIEVNTLKTVTVPGWGPGTSLLWTFPSRDQEIWAGGRPPSETQRATGTGSWLSGLSRTFWGSTWFLGLAGERSKGDRSFLTCSHSTNVLAAEENG